MTWAAPPQVHSDVQVAVKIKPHPGDQFQIQALATFVAAKSQLLPDQEPNDIQAHFLSALGAAAQTWLPLEPEQEVKVEPVECGNLKSSPNAANKLGVCFPFYTHPFFAFVYHLRDCVILH
jgi:hypothetical protein